MKLGGLRAAGRELRMLFDGGSAVGLSDRQLLARFSNGRGDAASEAAFATLMARHGPMVWGTCRRILRDPHAAEDAFQATFLILVRRAGSVRVEDSLGRWLHGVGVRVALRAKAAEARRRGRDLSTLEPAISDPGSDLDDLRSVIDEGSRSHHGDSGKQGVS